MQNPAQDCYREDSKDQITLVVGEDAYPFPIPLVRVGGKWQFDAEQGEEEMINRRVGLNELATISVLEDVVNAQRAYASESRDGSGITTSTGSRRIAATSARTGASTRATASACSVRSATPTTSASSARTICRRLLTA